MQHNMPNLQAEQAVFMIDGAELSKKHTSDEEIVLLSYTLGKFCLAVEDDGPSIALLDCACPTTVVGLSWIKEYINKPSQSQKNKVRTENSQRVFKFGGGEKRNSKVAVSLPCKIAGIMSVSELRLLMLTYHC